MYKLKTITIVIEDTEDQIGVNSDSSPKYQTYSIRHDPSEDIQTTASNLRAKIEAQQEDNRLAYIVSKANNDANNITELV